MPAIDLKKIQKHLKGYWEPTKVLLATVGAATIAASAINRAVLTENFLRFITTIVATLIGGGVAFKLNRIQQKIKQNDDNKAALALAAFIVGGQIEDLVSYRGFVFKGIKEVETIYKNSKVPESAIALWMYIRPMEYGFNPANEIELKNLGFLVSDHKKKDLMAAFSRLQLTGKCHTLLRQLTERVQETSIEIQQKLAERDRTCAEDERQSTIAAYEKYMGPALPQRMIDLTLQLLMRLEDDLSIYTDTLDQLKKAAEILWEDEASAPKWRMRITADNLPDLPPTLRAKVDELRMTLANH